MLKVDKKDSNKELIRLTLLNDLKPHGDITSEFTVDPKLKAYGKIVAKEDGILACLQVAQEILDECTKILSKELAPKFNFKKSKIKFHFKDGEKFSVGDLIAEIEGPAYVLLSAERTLLNFLQRLSGVASFTNKFVNKIKPYKVKLLDTRKTMPGMRYLGKEAVLCGGGSNHRLNLSDMVLIKENHLIFASAKKNKERGECLETFIKDTRARLLASKLPNKKQIKIECEVEKFSQIEPVIKAEVDVIMLDNFSPQDCKKAIALIKKLKQQFKIKKDIKIEASGGINLDNVIDYAKSGVDYLSVGALTNKPANIDLSMLLSVSKK